MNGPHPPPPSFSPVRRLGIALNVALSVLALGTVLVMVNYLAGRHFQRWLWTRELQNQLGGTTRRVLAGLTNDVQVTILFDRSEALFNPVSLLLKEYAYANPHILLEPVDPVRDLARAQTIAARYQLAQTEADLVIFDAGGRTRIVHASELSDYNLAELFAGEKDVKRVAFRGEQRFTEAIAGLMEAVSPVAYFLQGHQEHDPSSTDSQTGYSKFARVLQQKNIRPASLRLAGTNSVPQDCSLLVIAGPQAGFGPAELDAIRTYLKQGGRLLALVSLYRSHLEGSALERMLAEWGVAVGDNLVSDPANSLRRQDVVSTNFSSHPVMRPLAGSQLYVVLARSVDPTGAGATPATDAPRVVPLFATSTNGLTASDIDWKNGARVNPARDRRGAISLAVAAERGNLQGVSADRGSTRIIVVGESFFLANETIEKFNNLQFASQAVDWLLDRPTSIAGIAPQPLHLYQITLTNSQRAQSRLILLGVFPGAVLAFGLLVWSRRRA